MKALPPDTIVITGLGMCSSLGNAVMACAAARTQMSAGTELHDVWVRDEDDAEQRAIGHPISTAAGFQGAARLLCLAWPALEDLLEHNHLRALDPASTGLYLCLPDQASRAREGEEAPEAPIRSPGPGLCARLVQHTALGLPPSQWNHVDEGPTGVVRAVAEASVKLRSGLWHRCLVGAVDSLLDPRAVGWLQRAGRLKTPTKPDGLQPGEAGAFVLLERLDAARRRSAEVLAVVAGTSVIDDAPREPTGTPSGAGLAEAITRLLTTDDAWLVSDHNGEHHRAAELGNALVQVSRRFPATADGARWFPATSFGDTGAASAVVAICMATRSFARGYAAGASAIIAASSDGGCRGTLRIDAPHGASQR